METICDDESMYVSFPELYSSSHLKQNNETNIRFQERDHERIRIEQKLTDMYRQIGELTSMVKAPIEKMTSCTEENAQNVRNVETARRSDTV